MTSASSTPSGSRCRAAGRSSGTRSTSRTPARPGTTCWPWPTPSAMASLVDLSVPGSRIPDLLIVDANVVSVCLLASHPGQYPLGLARAARFFHSLIANNAVGVVTPTAFNGVLHVAIKAKYQRELLAH